MSEIPQQISKPWSNILGFYIEEHGYEKECKWKDDALNAEA
jgi:hypothetical protein